jgi:hypothetical protein
MGRTYDNSPRNNKKGLVGSAPKYTPEEFKEAFEAYCEHCDATQERPTISGMAFHMGFASRQSVYDYAKKEGYEYLAKRATLFVEKGYEQQVADGRGDGGIVFILKNMGWSDKQEIDHQSSDGSMSPKGKTLDDFYADTDD